MAQPLTNCALWRIMDVIVNWKLRACTQLAHTYHTVTIDASLFDPRTAAASIQTKEKRLTFIVSEFSRC